MTHQWSPNCYNRETTRPTTYLFRFRSLSRPASYMQASKAAGPRRSTHDWVKVKNGRTNDKRGSKHIQTARRPRWEKLKRRRRNTYRAMEENKENDAHEIKTTKAILRNRQRCSKREKSKPAKEEDSRTEKREVTIRGCP